MSAILWQWTVSFLLVLPGGFGPGFDPCAAADEKVNVTVIVILATDKNTEIEHKLECLAKAVKKLDADLTGFRLATTTSEAMIVGARKKFPLVEEQNAVLEVERCPKDPKRFCLKVKAPTLRNLTYTSCCGKYFPLLTGYKTRDGERVIIAVMVEPCKDDE